MKVNKSIAIWAFIIIAIITASIAYFKTIEYYPRTDDAYVHANIIQMGALVSGNVSAVYVKDHDHVKLNQLLFEIDPVPYQIALDHAKANLDVIRQNIEAGKSAVNAAEANVKKSEAEAENQQKQTERLLTLKKQNLISQSEADQASTMLTTANSNLKAAYSKLLEAKSQLGALDDTNAQLRLAQATVDAAQRNLNYTKIYAPFDGQLQLFKIRSGQIINSNTPLFALIEDGNTWISANFKETELQRIKVGQPVKIKIDMYPGQTFSGKVGPISRGSGAAFSLLPPENASGNWIKVTQRFPVKILLVQHDENKFPLRVGASCKVIIDTTTKIVEKSVIKKENTPSSATLSEKIIPEVAKEVDQLFWDDDLA